MKTELRQFADALAFIEDVMAKIYSVTKNPQLVECVEGHLLTGVTKFEACIELQRVAEKILSPTESCVLHALIEGRITEEAIHPARLESIRTKCLAAWRRVGLLPLNTFLNTSQKILDGEKVQADQKREAQERKRDAEQREAERLERVEAARLIRMRPSRRKRAITKIEQRKEAA